MSKKKVSATGNGLAKYTAQKIRFAAQPQFFFYLLLWLMVLLVAGTVSEKYLGLYQSQKLYFSSSVIWLGGFIPVPGGYTTLALIFINLLAKLVIERWTSKKLGTLIVHCGALLLILGGFLTAAFSSDGNMVIDEGSSSNFVSDYHDYEFVVSDALRAGHPDIAVFSQNQLRANTNLPMPSIPFEVTIESFFGNSKIVQRKQMVTDGSVHGMLVANDMQQAPLLPQEEENRAGLVFRIQGAGEETDGRYAIFDEMPIQQTLSIGNHKYILMLRHKRTYLPFSVALIKFDKQMYPGADMARSYSSQVILQDGQLQWHSLISMNNPMRYKGYTFYQSSFIENRNGRATVLEVVENVGAIFPYVSSIMICVGLLVHMFIRIPQLKIKAKREK